MPLTKGAVFLKQAAKVMQKEVHHELPLQQLLLLLDVADEEGISQAELGERSGMPSSSISRNVQALSGTYGLIDANMKHPERPKSFALRLTEKGRKTLAKIQEIAAKMGI